MPQQQTINHILQRLTAAGLAVRQATKKPIENEPKKLVLKPKHKNTSNNFANLLEEVKSQPYFKVFMKALEREGIKKKKPEVTKINSYQSLNSVSLQSKTENNKETLDINDLKNPIEKADSSTLKPSRRPGLRKLSKSRKLLDDQFSLSADKKVNQFKKKKGKRGRPKLKKKLHIQTNTCLENTIKTIPIKTKRKTKSSNDEVKAIEKDATKELMDALMKSAIQKGKAANSQQLDKEMKIDKSKFSKSVKPNNEEEINEAETQKSDHTPRYKYLTGFEDRPYSCPYCQGCFTKKSYLKQHVRTHTGEKPHKCSVCNRRFRQQAALKRHMMTHTGEKPFKCVECDKSYSDKAVLNEHMRVHTGEKPFLCHICTKSFAYTFSFKQHMKRHKGERDHHCELCDAKFYTASSLTTHVKKSHTGIRDAVCDLCGRAFVDKTDLSRHKRKIHNGNNNSNQNNICKATNPMATQSIPTSSVHPPNFSRNHPPPNDQFSLMGAFTQHLMGATNPDPSQNSLQNHAMWGTPPAPHGPFPPTNIPWGGSTMWGQGNFSGYRP